MPGWIIGAAGVGAVIAFVAWVRDENRALRRAIRQVAVSRVADAPEGLVRICGTLGYPDSDPLLEAPISQRACVAWRVVVWCPKSNTGGWTKLVDISKARPFWIDDDNELAFVQGEHVSLLVRIDAKTTIRQVQTDPGLDDLGLYPPIAPHILKFLDAHQLSRFPHLRIVEGTLESGERVTAVGVGTWKNDPKQHHGYRDVGRRFHLSELPDGRILASDEAKLTAE